jgi:hypothetical protein
MVHVLCTDKPEKPAVTWRCSTGLDTDYAAVFFKRSFDGLVTTAKEMTKTLALPT